jgi:hypothetical protein
MAVRPIAVTFAALLAACEHHPVPANLPHVTPPVRAATPPGFIPPSAASVGAVRAAAALGSLDLADRFFVAAGPTSIFGNLGFIDGRIDEINQKSRDAYSACVSQAPVAYQIAPFGETLTFYAQCWMGSGANRDFVQFGTKDGVTYLFDAHGAGIAAVVTPVAGDGGKYHVRAWIGTNSVGCPTWDGCSYGVLELKADESTREFELAAAGINVGYCGAQLRADATDVYAVASPMTPPGSSCGAVESLCVAPSDATTPSLACAGAGLTTFELSALGRTASVSSTGGTWDASQYPGGAANTIILNGSSDGPSPADSVQFGPTSPTPGVGRLDS